MLLPDTGSSQFSREQAHIPGQQEPLLTRHGGLNTLLNRLSFGTRIRDGHSRMVARYFLRIPVPGSFPRGLQFTLLTSIAFLGALRRFSVVQDRCLQELPIKIPVMNTSAPPNPTCKAAEGMGVSM